MTLHSYSSPFALGHKALARDNERPGLLEAPVLIEEKIDGSQFSFSLSETGRRLWRETLVGS